ncbi:alpha-L-fucosidase [Virgibacillus sp. YIM 98842]|uniref:alpha-L-fucosidase n=1 Tax=Virgibacillus sp. YIM 98842 TaxID=2663533 RepID=UPI0013DA04C2|nr:alpha-L-fucosidase [Virgibacillus sp. YIM 98842]
MKGKFGRAVNISLILTLIVSLFTMSFHNTPINAFSSGSIAEVDADELLDVSFGGVFSTEKVYTNPDGEMMDGTLSRRTANEEINEGRIYLNGGQDGVDFDPRTPLGSGSIDQPLVVEAEFTPEAEPGHYDTLISIGGNIYVRYTSNTTLEYGFDVNHNGGWTSVSETVSAPKEGEEHSIAIVYEPDGNGATMRAFLNGMELPEVSHDEAAPLLNQNSENPIGFGNEVHPAGLDRGFEGSFNHVVATTFDGEFDFSLIKTMDVADVERNLSLWALGSLEETAYSPSEDEVMDGELNVQGGEITDFGRFSMSGDASFIDFNPDGSIMDENSAIKDSIAEVLVDPDSIDSGDVLIDLAGAVQVRKSEEDEMFEVIADSEVAETLDASGKLDDEYIHLTLVYHNRGEGATAELWLGNEQLGETIHLSEPPAASRNAIRYAGSENSSDASFSGDVYGVAFALLDGEFNAQYLGLLAGPCTVPEDLEPANRIAIKPNECGPALVEKASQVRPTPKQVQWQEYEKTAFIHYGINTYYGVEWGGFNEDPNMFHPTDLDTDQWARTLKESGFEMAILTVKHHDGFVLYPTRYTNFSVASSSWRNGEGDVLREFVDSMNKYDIKVGVYLSPADHHAYHHDNPDYHHGIFANGSEPSMRTIPTLVEGDDRADDPDLPTFELPATDYGEMFLNQLYEVLTEYGEIHEVWFDGAQGHIPGDAHEPYDWESYYELINELAPEAVIAVSGPDVRWVGNESGWARENEWSVVGAATDANGRQYTYPSAQQSDLGSRSVLADAAANGIDYLTWWPAEVDVSIRNGWFYHDNQQPKSLDHLRQIYYDSIARNSVLLLNIPPDPSGQFADADVEVLKEWHQSTERDFALDHAKDAAIHAENGAEGADPDKLTDGIYDSSWEAADAAPSSITFTMDEEVAVDRITLQENINHGQQVESFAIDVRNSDGEWEEIYTNEVIGYKRIVVLDEEVKGKEFRLRILQSRAPVHISKVGLHQSLPEEVTTSIVQKLIEHNVDKNEAAHSLNLHMKAVSLYAEQGESEKVVRHMEGFKILLDHQLDNDLISLDVYNILHSQAEELIKEWE